MSEPYELRSNNPGFGGPNDPEGPTCECGNVLPLGDEPQPCADAKCREKGCEECQIRCDKCLNWFCFSHMEYSGVGTWYCQDCMEEMPL